MLRRFLVLIVAIVKLAQSFSDVGKWDLPLNGNFCEFTIAKSLFKDSELRVVVHCQESANVSVAYQWEQSPCSPDYFHYFEEVYIFVLLNLTDHRHPFGAVRPRLGPALQRVGGAALCWAVLAGVEAWLRLRRRAAQTLLLAEAPISLLDSAICWWVFVSLAHTTRTLRLRRNTIKLNLYRHFTNTLIFAVISSVVFMLYSLKSYKIQLCITEWKEVWMDEAYWHMLFAGVLAVIMLLWRPTNNNQRYAFTPLLDYADDDDEEEEQFVNDAYGVKMRGTGASGSGGGGEGRSGGGEGKQAEPLDELRWVEEHIPASALPVLDSDEEIVNTKFEVSKMQ
ncbi:Transmembrane protein 87A [Papilio machaon]|uniref:Transmembrane protein 87A n=1 Tax=Papilio machaon TaxID=76193 RepID=A0A194QN16_PAPMA|nr:Transmembrane protein 87A [Papilio machaon]